MKRRNQRRPRLVPCLVLDDAIAHRYNLPPAGREVSLTVPEARHLAEVGAVQIVKPWKARPE